MSQLRPERDDPVLGKLTHDGYYYNGTVQVGRVDVEFSIGTYEVDDIEQRFERAQSLCRNIEAVVADGKAYAAARLLDLKNGAWREEDDRAVSVQEFIERMTLSSVTIDHDGALALYFEDGGIFYGHDILVVASSSGEFEDAGIRG